MTDFTPEHYLAAARIAHDDLDWEIEYFNDDFEIQYWPEAGPQDTIGPLPKSFSLESSYINLREALDKEYGIRIHWSDHSKVWISVCGKVLMVSTAPTTKEQVEIRSYFDSDITSLMMRNVVALVEAGVME